MLGSGLGSGLGSVLGFLEVDVLGLGFGLGLEFGFGLEQFLNVDPGYS